MTEQWLTAKQVWTLLGISERSFYRIGFFRARKHYPLESDVAVRYAASDLALYQRIRSAKAA